MTKNPPNIPSNLPVNVTNTATDNSPNISNPPNAPNAPNPLNPPNPSNPPNPKTSNQPEVEIVGEDILEDFPYLSRQTSETPQQVPPSDPPKPNISSPKPNQCDDKNPPDSENPSDQQKQPKQPDEGLSQIQ